MLSEKSQLQKDILHDLTSVWSQNSRTHRGREKGGSQGLGGVGQGVHIFG